MSARKRKKVDKRGQIVRQQKVQMLSKEQFIAIWPGPVVTLDRVPAIAILEGVKQCENRTWSIKGSRNMEGIPIGIHIKKKESKPKVVKFLNSHSLFKTQLLCGRTSYAGMTPEEFYVNTHKYAGQIVGYMICDTHPDPDINYGHANYPINRGHIWYIHDVFQFRYPVAGFQGAQSWQHIRHPTILQRFVRAIPVSFSQCYIIS